ncbi:MAG TPA: hypothetical protein VGO47_12880 [Chlamydiales bacterium]|nr:hypothetical protein [Chlamydiales bacterium]
MQSNNKEGDQGSFDSFSLALKRIRADTATLRDQSERLLRYEGLSDIVKNILCETLLEREVLEEQRHSPGQINEDPKKILTEIIRNTMLETRPMTDGDLRKTLTDIIRDTMLEMGQPATMKDGLLKEKKTRMNLNIVISLSIMVLMLATIIVPRHLAFKRGSSWNTYYTNMNCVPI